MIAFVKVEYEATSGERVDPNPKKSLFSEDCVHCGFPGLYSADELTPFEEAATVSFVTHKAFSE